MLKLLAMKHKLLLLILGIAAVSCQEKISVNATLESEENKTAQVQFVEVLSKAVYENSELREFLKDEASVKFDKDYDVFYPFAKDKEVVDGITFRDYLLKYTSESTLAEIENELPLLNILVPDWEWLGAFSIKSWNTDDDDVLVAYDNPEETHPVYLNGEKIGELLQGEYPEAPTLIVKNNERMKLVEPVTRVESCSYDFADDAYRPVDTRVEAVVSYIYPTITPGSNYVDANIIKKDFPDAVAGWEEYGTQTNTSQRNYTYFKIAKGETSGILDDKIRESVVAIRLNNITCMEQKAKDPYIDDDTKKDTDYGSVDEILDAIWRDGQLEILLYATTLKDDGTVHVLNENAIPVNAQDLFDISYIRKEFYHKTWLSRRKFVYLVDTDNLLPKWYSLTTPLAFSTWKPYEESTVLNIHAYEVDGETEMDVTDNIKYQDGLDASIKYEEIVDFKYYYNLESLEREIKYKIKEGSDDLGSIEVEFDDYIIRSEDNGEYELEYYTTGDLDFILIPQK